MSGQIRYDPGSDTLYLLIKEGYEEEFVEVADGVNVELDEDGDLLGIEILNASRLLPLVMQAGAPSQTQSRASTH
jgi:uncharacterized protein YuzE